MVAAIAAVVRRAGAGGDDADPQHRRIPVPFHRTAPAEQLVVVVLHAPGEGQKLPAVGGQLDLAGAPVEQLHVELLLEATDLLAERRRRDAEALRGPSEVQLLGEHAEVPDHVDRHIHARILASD